MNRFARFLRRVHAGRQICATEPAGTAFEFISLRGLGTARSENTGKLRRCRLRNHDKVDAPVYKL